MCNDALNDKLNKLIQLTETLKNHVLNRDIENHLIILSLRNSILEEINSMDLNRISTPDKNRLSRILSDIAKEDAATNKSLLKIKLEVADKIKEIKKNKHASAKYLEIKGR
ncbi:hypothetical protein AN395_02117 [Pseudoalteromonas sp. P1-30]|jgi:hypothetical protein|uniref:hypothetical protein n=1 Tax=Pseudoalteromonas sp. P1-30 TaxID=1723760 RepID=UPI0006D6445D|nr:hypothetical protein [Pseudoalteromonas sp. P1-30]KPV91348.1 hypothetical protein AN395_02117 [Pseudoalteromonas sp. P1-30]